MSRRKFLLTSLGAAGAVSPTGWAAPVPAPAGESPARAAERILIGRVRPLDAPGAQAEAIAIANGKILAVGSRNDVMKYRDSATVVRDLGNAGIIPGFSDAHAHLEREGLKTLRPTLAGAKSIEEVLSRIRELAAKTPSGQWILTMPVGEGPFYFGGPAYLAEKRMPTREELDRAAPNNPVCISAPFGFWGNPPTYTALNSAALKLNGIDRSTRSQLEEIEIFHDQNGEPTGVISTQRSTPGVEFELLSEVPRFSLEDRVEGVRRAQKLYHAKGTTTTFEGHGEAPMSIAAYRHLWERGELTMRVGFCVSPTWSSFAEVEPAMQNWLSYARGRGFGDSMLRISGVNIVYGGDRKVADLAHRRLPDTNWSGQVEQFSTPAEFEEMCMIAARNDLRVHVVGGGRRDVLSIFERVNAKYPLAERRWVVQHVSGSSMEELQMIRKLGLLATLIPASSLWKGGGGARAAGDEALANLIAPARQLMDLGVHVAAGTDNIPYDPIFTLWAVTNRQERTSGRVVGAASRLSIEEGLKLLTTAGAWLTFDENVKGPLKVGKYADLAVLSSDPMTMPAAELRDLTCTASMVGGKVVYGDLG